MSIDSLELHAKDILTEDGLEEYEKGREIFFRELVELNAILYLAEQVINFPFDLFSSPDKTVFFSIVMHSFYDSVILTITRLTTDQQKNVYTLLRFKNKVRDWVKPEFKKEFEIRVKGFEKKTKELRKKAEALRNRRIAHLDEDFVSGTIKLSYPDLSELQDLCKEITSLFNALCFNVENLMLPEPYSLNRGHNTDIEQLLDCLARDSYLLNMPEQNLQRWSVRQQKLTQEQMNVLNRYRRKFGLPDV